MSDRRVRHYRRNLGLERDNAALYARLAELAREPQLKRVYRRIAEGEQANAAFWEARLRELGATVPVSRPRLRVRVLARLARVFGTDFVMPTVVRLEHADRAGAPVDRGSDGENLLSAQPRAGRDHRHRAGRGNTLRASVLGANDGLVSNVSLVMGMAGAGSGNRAVLLAGLAGLVAGACSMSLGEWLSVNSSREFYQAQIRERAERLATAPEEGERHVANIYRDKGMSRSEAKHLAGHLAESPSAVLDTLVREELGVDPGELGGSAWGAAISSFCLFAFGAAFPVAPYFFLGGREAFIASILCTAAGLSLIAVGSALFTGRGVLFSIVRQFAITASAAAITWGVGAWLGGIIGR